MNHTWKNYSLAITRIHVQDKHIEKFKVRHISSEHNKVHLSPEEEITREKMLELLPYAAVVTAIPHLDLSCMANQFELGSPVFLVTLQGKSYLKTRKNDNPSDNLDMLPRF